MKKQLRSFIILGIVVVLLIGAYVGVLLWNKAQAERAKQEAEDSIVYVSQLADAVEITYSNADGTTYSFARNEEGAWYYTPDEDFPLNGENLDNIEAEVMGLAAVYSVELNDDLSYYGLDTGKILRVTDSNGETLDMVMGIRSSDEESYYVMLAGGDTCYTIDGDLNRYTNKTLLDMADLRDRADMDEERLISVTFEGRLGTFVLDKETVVTEQEITDPETGETSMQPVTEYVWYVTTASVERKPLRNFDIPAELPSYSSTDKYLTAVVDDDLAYLNYDFAYCYNPTAEQLEETGLNDPKYVITIVYETDEMLEDGTYATETMVIHVGNYHELYEEDGTEIIPTMLKRYVYVEGDSFIYIMDEDDYERLEMTYFEFNGHSVKEEPVGVASLLAAEEPAEEADAEEPETETSEEG